MNFTRPTLYKVLALVVLAVLIYSNSFHVPFHFDDAVVIVNNPAVHLAPDWAAVCKAAFHFQASRVLSLVTFAVNYGLHRLDVVGYHIFNLTVHIAAALAVWWLGEILRKLFNRQPLPVRTSNGRASKKKAAVLPTTASSGWRSHLPFAAALIFLVHPVNTEAVTYISQRCESMAALFYILSVCCFLQGRMRSGRPGWFFAATVVCGLLAMLSKETALSLPLAILGAESFFFRREKFPWTLAMVCAGALLIIPALFDFDLRILTEPHASQSHLGDVLTWPRYLLTELRVFVTYLRLMFVPVGLNLDYDFAMSRSLLEPAVLGSGVVLIGLILTAWRGRTRYPAFSWAVLWFFVTLSAHLIPRTHVIFEHKLYLVGAGVIPALCLGVGTLIEDRRKMIAGVAVIVTVFSVMTFQRNTVWQSPISLWQDTLAKSPQKGRVYLSLGAALAQNGAYEKAVDILTRALAMMPDAEVYRTRAAVYVLMKNDIAALRDFNRAIERSPALLDAYIGRGELFARHGQFHQAALDFNKAIELNPQKPDGFKMRGRLNEALRRPDAALADYDRSLVIDPGDAQTTAWRGYIYALKGQRELAARDFETAMRLDPNLPEAYVYRAMLRKDAGHAEDAIADFNRALAIKPSALGFYQRGQLMLELNRMDEAMNDVNAALKIDAQYDLAYSLRARLRAEKRQLKPAVEDLDRAISINPQFTDGYLNRGFLHLLLGEEQKAVDDFSKAIALNPNAQSAYRRRAKAYMTLKKYDLAIADLSNIIELNPSSAVDYANRGKLYQAAGDLKHAQADLQKAKSLGLQIPSDFLTDMKTETEVHEHSHR